MRRKRDVVREQISASRVEAAGGAALAGADIVVWAVKPQVFGAAAAPCAPFVGGALQLSVMAGIRSDAIARATGSERVVRAMPNTPALIGDGIAGLFARAAVDAADRAAVERVLAPTGETLWVAQRERPRRRDGAVGLGPGLRVLLPRGDDAGRAPRWASTATQGRRLAHGDVQRRDRARRARRDERPQTLRARVTSKGGTTHAAITRRWRPRA